MATAPRFEKVTDAAGVHIITRDTLTGLEWSTSDLGRHTNRAENSAAEAACAALDLGGHTDWRLPTVDELETIRDRNRFSPACDPDAFPACPLAWFWTATPDASSPKAYAWLVYFVLGNSDIYRRDDDNRVRAVRGPARQFFVSLEG